MPRFKIELEARVLFNIERDATDEKDAYQQAVYEIEHGIVDWDKIVQMKLRDVVEVSDAKSNK